MKNSRSLFLAALLGALVPLCLAATASYFGAIKTDSNGLWIGTATTDKIAFHGKAPIVQPTNAAQAALTDSTGGTANGTLADGLTVTAPAAATVGSDIAAFTDPPSAAEMALLRTFVNALKADNAALSAKVATLVTDAETQNDNDKELVTLLNRLRLDLVNLGLIKGS